MNLIFLLLQVLFFFLLIRKKSIIHPLIVGYFIAFFYFNSVFIDYLLLGISPDLISKTHIYVDFNSFAFFEYNALVFLFSLLYFVLVYSEKTHTSVSYFEKKFFVLYSDLKGLLNLVVIVFIFLNIYTIVSDFSLTRYERGGLQTPLKLLLRNCVNYFFIILFNMKFKKNLLLKVFFTTNILYFFLSYEREPLVILFLCVLYKYRFFMKKSVLFLFSSFLLFLLFIWKLFYTLFLYQNNNKLSNFLEALEFSTFSFSGIDPRSSFLLFYDYLDGNSYIYNEYLFSYFTGIIFQVERIFIDTDYKTLSELSTEYYTGGDYGVASSVLLESMLNFSFLGPLFLSFFLIKVLRASLKLQYQFGTGIIVVSLFIISKFMRTELATLLKLQVLPLLISMFFIKILFKLKKVNEK